MFRIRLSWRTLQYLNHTFILYTYFKIRSTYVRLCTYEYLVHSFLRYLNYCPKSPRLCGKCPWVPFRYSLYLQSRASYQVSGHDNPIELKSAINATTRAHNTYWSKQQSKIFQRNDADKLYAKHYENADLCKRNQKNLIQSIVSKWVGNATCFPRFRLYK